jgi:mRNA interferase MazF
MVDFDPARGSEQAGRRPAVIISSNMQNRHMNTVLIAALTTTIRSGPLTVVLPAGRPLPEPGSILAFQVMTIDKSRLGGYLGRLDRKQIAELERAMKIAFGLS